MLGLGPHAHLKFYLESHAHLPPQKRPAFIVKVLTASEWVRVDQLTAQAQDAGPAEGVAKLVEAIRIGLRGWANVHDADGQLATFDPQRLPDLLTIYQLWEVVDGMLGCQQGEQPQLTEELAKADRTVQTMQGLLDQARPKQE